MPGENLTRLEANVRADLLKVDSYEVSLDLTTSDKTFLSTTSVKFSANQIGASTFIDAITAEVHSVVLNGESLDVSVVSDCHPAIDKHRAHSLNIAYQMNGLQRHRLLRPQPLQFFRQRIHLGLQVALSVGDGCDHYSSPAICMAFCTSATSCLSSTLSNRRV